MMIMKKNTFTAILCLVLSIFMIPVSSFARAADAEKFDGEIARTTETLYEGVECTHISLGADSKYGLNEFWVVEFDPKQEGLSIDVTMGGEYANKLTTVQKTVENFNETNEESKVAISAINGDLWMVSYAHARVEGSGTEYGGYSDAVVTKSLTVPRGLNIYNGEIITSPHTQYETPYEGAFDSFGITPEGDTVLGTPSLTINCTDLTQDAGSSVKVNGLNRLPANNAIMLYSDKGCPENYSLSDAYEIVIDCDYDYTVKQDAVIKGKITAICKEGDENPKMQENRFILCARGSKAIKKIENFNIGDEIEFSFTLKGTKKDNDIWQRVTNAVGGHMKLVVDGKAQNMGDATVYPTSIIGNTADGKVVFITNDGRQKDYSIGLKIKDMPEILVALGVQNAFLLDGGGSATMVNINGEGSYDLVNHPCDKDENGNYGQARTVVNSIILSYIKAAEPTEAPNQETEAPTQPAEDGSSSTDSGCGSIISGSIAAVFVMSLGSAFCLKRKKKKRA